MATTPGILTHWPWECLGSFKYVILAPWVMKSSYSYLTSDDPEVRDFSNVLILPFLIWRMIHNQMWISLSRYRTVKGNNRIIDKGLEFEQVDRERNWDDQIIFNGLILYIGSKIFPGGRNVPVWRTDGIIITAILHSTAVEFLYYWLHRALHHHFLYSRYHSHHHSSIVTEPITSVSHPFAEHVSYFVLFAIPLLTTTLTRTSSLASIFGYVTYIDFMNNLGHCNFELIPRWLFTLFPPLKYLIYTPSFHSLHHTQSRANYCLFMSFYDYIYNTAYKSSDSLYESSLERNEEIPCVVHLTHMTTHDSIYHLRLGFADLASKPYVSKWYLWLLWPVTLWSTMLTWICGGTFVVERHRFNNLKLQTWYIPKYKTQYLLQSQKTSINSLIEEAILEAEKKGTKVVSLGLLNQSEELNDYGALYVKRHSHLKIKVVDGSSLAVAIVLNNLPKGTTKVLLRGKLNKIAYHVAVLLCQKGIQVGVVCDNEYVKLKSLVDSNSSTNLVLSESYSDKIWLVGDELSDEEQLKASKGTQFVPFSQFAPKQLRKDCFYHYTPAMLTPKSLENVHACENWLPRRVMSAWRIAGIVHALEDWDEHECGFNSSNFIPNFNKVWESTLRHGFQPITLSS